MVEFMASTKAITKLKEGRSTIAILKEQLNYKRLLLQLKYETELCEMLDQEQYIIDNVALIIEMIGILSIENEPTNDVYAGYVSRCSIKNTESMSQVEFSRFVLKWFDYEIIDKKIAGRKYRLFVKANQCELQDDSFHDTEVIE